MDINETLVTFVDLLAMYTLACVGACFIIGVAMLFFALTSPTHTACLNMNFFGEAQIETIAFAMGFVLLCAFIIVGFMKNKPELPLFLFDAEGYKNHLEETKGEKT